jgi:hypothetical protein
MKKTQIEKPGSFKDPAHGLIPFGERMKDLKEKE